MEQDVSKCISCDAAFKDNENKLKCDFCENIYHLNCAGISATTFTHFKKIDGAFWSCKLCVKNKEDFIHMFKRLDKIEKILNDHSYTLQNYNSKLDKISSNVTTPQLPVTPKIRMQKRSFSQIVDSSDLSNGTKKIKKKLCIVSEITKI